MPLTSGRYDEYKPKPGFQGSETTGVEIIIYPQQAAFTDPITFTSEPVKFGGRNQPSIISANVTKTLGAASGTWSFVCKPGRNEKDGYSQVAQSLFSHVIDDDWIDIVFLRHGRRYHVMRGLVEDVRRGKVVSGSGATSTIFTISGRDFGKIWEQTPIWFNTYSSVNLGGAISQKVFSGMQNILGSPKKAVLAFLRDMLRELDELGTASWVLPSELPNRGPGSFLEAVNFDTSGYPINLDNQLIALSQNWLMPSGNLWQLAKEWSDPLFNELYCDIMPDSLLSIGFAQFNPQAELPPEESGLNLIFREKPFPTINEGKDSAWFYLPLNIVPREQIISSDTGRSGAERFNAFFVAPQLTQELVGQGAMDMYEPLWSPDDISRHGFRRFDVMTKYIDIVNANLLTVIRDFREKIRDWYCLNPYLLNGTITLGVLRPAIKIGTKIRIPGARSQDEDETYYVEQVSHSWAFGSGGKTTLGVTRGFVGQDDLLLNTLQTLVNEYVIPEKARAGYSYELPAGIEVETGTEIV